MLEEFKIRTASDDLSLLATLGALSAIPTSRQQDESKMADFFAAGQYIIPFKSSSSPMMSSNVMQEGLRMYGLFNFTASSSDPVSGLETVTGTFISYDSETVIQRLINNTCVDVCIYIYIRVCLCICVQIHICMYV